MNYWERPEYWEKSWRLEETCNHSNYSERSSANVSMKNSKKRNNNNNNNNDNDNNSFSNGVYFQVLLSDTNYLQNYTGLKLAWWLECSPMARETCVQSQVESYQRLKKMVLDASLLNTQHYKVRIKGKVEQSRERSSATPKLWWKGSLRVTSTINISVEC